MCDKKKFESKQYTKLSLNIENLNESPYLQFDKWYKEVLNSHIDFPNAMVLSTATATAIPSSRVVLLKNYSEEGFSYYSNSNSGKGRDIDENPRASICFWWSIFERQVRIEGNVELVSDKLVDDYFSSRPRGSQISAVISKQSEVVSDREYLEKLYEQYDKKNLGQEIKRPDFWKGYLLKPNYFEFWQGRKNRLHDRFKYSLDTTAKWKIERLYP